MHRKLRPVSPKKGDPAKTSNNPVVSVNSGGPIVLWWLGYLGDWSPEIRDEKASRLVIINVGTRVSVLQFHFDDLEILRC